MENKYDDILKRKTYDWATEDQKECCCMIFDLIKGAHHLVNKIKPYGNGIEYNTWDRFSTFDFNRLSILVFMAHDRCIRASICPSGPRMIKIVLFKRQGRSGDMSDRHPDLKDSIDIYRRIFSIENEKIAGPITHWMSLPEPPDDEKYLGCGNHSCLLEKPKGQGTNSGCSCLSGLDGERKLRLEAYIRRLKHEIYQLNKELSK